VSEPKNCLKCEHHSQTERVALGYTKSVYECNATGASRLYNVRRILLSYRVRQRITPPAWCPLQEEKSK